MTVFLKLLSDQDKGKSLLDTCTAIREGKPDARVFTVNPESFKTVPGAPFSYWVSDSIRDTFKRLSAFESEGRTAKQGLATANDNRFVREWWEIPLQLKRKKWFPFAKGGAYSPFYADIYLVVNWANHGLELKSFHGSFIRSPDLYFRPGLTWPNATTLSMSTRFLPLGCIFGHMGPSGFFEGNVLISIASHISIFNSKLFNFLVEIQLALAAEGRKHYEVGIIQRTPIPTIDANSQTQLATLARRSWSLKRTLDTTNETSHAFLLPDLLRTRLGEFRPQEILSELAKIQTEIDEIAFRLYGFTDADKATMEEASQNSSSDNAEEVEDEDNADIAEKSPSVEYASLLSWMVGVIVGRFDYRLATGERIAPVEPEPFDPLPEKSPGMLPDALSPLFPNNGILVDDPNHPLDIEGRIREVLDVLWKDKATNIEKEACEILGISSLREYFRKPSFFFADHLKRYSKSRRAAPIYLPLSTRSGEYTIWIYYHSLNDQTLPKIVIDILNPKIDETETVLSRLNSRDIKTLLADERKEQERLKDLLEELVEFKTELERVAKLPYKPNLNDGVEITTSPLYKLFRFPAWQKRLKEAWEKLEEGNYDWAHLAYSIWPDRVKEKCKKDKSISIAHDLENLYEEPVKEKKVVAKKKAKDTKKENELF